MTRMAQSTVEHLTHDALLLPESDRMRLVRVLLRSLEPQSAEGVDTAWNAEVTRRVDAVHQGTAQGRSAEDVFREIRAGYEK